MLPWGEKKNKNYWRGLPFWAVAWDLSGCTSHGLKVQRKLMVIALCSISVQVLLSIHRVLMAVLWLCGTRTFKSSLYQWLNPWRRTPKLSLVGLVRRAYTGGDVTEAALAATATPDAWRLSANLMANDDIALWFSGKIHVEIKCQELVSAGRLVWRWGVCWGQAWAGMESCSSSTVLCLAILLVPFPVWFRGDFSLIQLRMWW